MSIPTVVVEEHHEVFPVWHHAMQQCVIPSSGNLLLHVDEHSDMSLPRFRRPLPATDACVEAVLNFTYSELDIGNFIWPAIYQGIFSKVSWLRVKHVNPIWRSMLICAKDENRREFVTGSSLANTPYEHATDQRAVEYNLVTISDAFPRRQSWTLDVDLDYLCCNSYPDVSDQMIEVTKEQYFRLSTDIYHFLRISPGSKLSWEELNGRYYIRFNSFCQGVRPTYPLEQIELRLKALCDWLSTAESAPILITICRSVHSGYTPAAEVDRMQSLLLEQLNALWPVCETSLHDFTKLALKEA